MKNPILFILPFFLMMIVTAPSFAQGDKTLRPSPPAEAHGMIDSAKVDILYSTPGVKGRVVWGDLVPYGKVWRTGANEATVFETNKDILVNGQRLPAGKYGLFTIPGEQAWTFIFNSTWDQWGSFKYDAGKDVLRIVATPQKSPVFNERMLFEIRNHTVSLFWENLMISIEVKG